MTNKYELTPNPSHPNKILNKLGLRIKRSIDITNDDKRK